MSESPNRPLEALIPNPKLRFMDQCREVMRFQHFSIRTEEAYLGWIRRFILWSGKRHPRDMGEPEVRAFLTHLATDRKVSASTQNQALNALLFVYQKVLRLDLDWVDGFERARRPPRIPTVLSRDETTLVLSHLSGVYQVIGKLLYGSGLRLLEALRLRVKDVDFARGQIIVRSGKGDTDRVTLLPELSPISNLLPHPYG